MNLSYSGLYGVYSSFISLPVEITHSRHRQWTQIPPVYRLCSWILRLWLKYPPILLDTITSRPLPPVPTNLVPPPVPVSPSPPITPRTVPDWMNISPSSWLVWWNCLRKTSSCWSLMSVATLLSGKLWGIWMLVKYCSEHFSVIQHDDCISISGE